MRWERRSGDGETCMAVQAGRPCRLAAGFCVRADAAVGRRGPQKAGAVLMAGLHAISTVWIMN